MPRNIGLSTVIAIVSFS